MRTSVVVGFYLALLAPMLAFAADNTGAKKTYTAAQARERIEQRARKAKALKATQQRKGAAGAQRLSGVQKRTIANLVIGIRFADEDEFLTTSTRAVDTGLFNANQQSVKTYIEDQSYGAWSVNSVFLDGGSSTPASYQDIYPRAYYESWSATNPIGYLDTNKITSDDSDVRFDALVERAVAWASNSNNIPSTTELDVITGAAAQGYPDANAIDSITFMLSGKADAKSEIFWPFTSSYSGATDLTLKGKYVNDYQVQVSDMYQQRNDLLGALCHETMHIFGLPDYYRYVMTGDPLGKYDLMDETTPVPQNVSAYIRYRNLGWGKAPAAAAYGSNTIGRLGGISTAPTSRIVSMGQGDYLLFEYRQKTGWDASIPKSGLLVYRMNDEMMSGGLGNMMTTWEPDDELPELGMSMPDSLYLYRPNERTYDTKESPWYLAARGTVDAAPFSRESGRTSFGSLTNRAQSFFASDGTLMPYGISNVGSAAGETISFSFNKLVPPKKLSHSAYITLVRHSTGEFNARWSTKSYAPKYRKLTLSRNRSAVRFWFRHSSGSKVYAKVAGGKYKRVTSSYVVKNIKRGGKKSLYIKCVAPAGNSHTYKIVIRRNR